jgi:hypothetical protein
MTGQEDCQPISTARLGEPDEIATLAMFLATGDVSP